MIIQILGLNIDPVKEVRKRIDDVSNTDYLDVRKNIIEIMNEQDVKRGLRK